MLKTDIPVPSDPVPTVRVRTGVDRIIRTIKPAPRIIRPTPEEDAKFAQLRELGQELHIPILTHKWRFVNRDRDGNVVDDVEMWADSFVRNAYNHLASQMMSKNGDGAAFTGGDINFTQVSSTLVTGNRGIRIGDANQNLEDTATSGLRGPAADNGRGIVVGSSATAFSFEHTALQAIIAEGTAAGQLNYTAQTALADAFAALVYTVTHQRFFNNNSGGNVSVNEVGMYLDMNNSTVVTTVVPVMTARDVLGATIVVPDTGQLDVSYDMALTFPA